MTSTDPAAWESYAIAMMGAAAVLVGLIFVGLSINLERLLAAPWLFARAGAAIAELVTLLIACALVLVPDQPATVLGLELMVLGLGASILLALLLVRRRSDVDPRYRGRSDSAAVMGFAGVGLLALTGLATALGLPGGLYWLVPASLVLLVRPVLDSWVLLVEVNR